MNRSLIHLALVCLCLVGISGCDRSTGAGAKQGESLAAKDVSEVRALSDCGGEIRHVVLHVPTQLADRLAKPACDLLKGLSTKARVSFLCEDDAAVAAMKAHLESAGLKDRPTTAFVVVGGPLSVWARDRYIAVRSDERDGAPLWMIPRLPPHIQEARRKHEQALPSKLYGPLGITTWDIPLFLEGGNVVATDARVFVGININLDNAYAQLPSETSRELDRIFAQPVVLVGDDHGRAPFPHVDMYLTPIAEDHLLVASPALGHEILGKAGGNSREAARAALLGDPDPSPKRMARFDQTAELLRQREFKITRLPYLDNRNGDFAVTYNNVLQEHRDGKHIVFMPIYGIPALDDAAKRVYESLGCEVVTVDVSPISQLLGAIRCMVNVVDRGTNPISSDAPSKGPQN